MKDVGFGLAMLSLGLLAACSNSSSSSSEDASTDAFAEASTSEAGLSESATSEASSDGSGLTDAVVLADGQIVGVVIAANTGEIELSNLAIGIGSDGGTFGLDAGDAGVDAYVALDSGMARYANPMVGQFAQEMIAAHTESNAAIVGLGIAPASSAIQTSLQSAVSTDLTDLSSLSGTPFDIAYMQIMVSTHSAVLGIVTNDLLPNATSPQLKTYLQGTLLPAVQAHLAMATAILAELTEAGVGDAALLDATGGG